MSLIILFKFAIMFIAELMAKLIEDLVDQMPTFSRWGRTFKKRFKKAKKAVRA